MIIVRIVCFGDSNAYGYDPRGFFGDRYDAGERWVDLLAKKTCLEAVNLGVCGREIPGRLDFTYLLPECDPGDRLLVMLGTNDLLQGATAAEAAARMEAFLKVLLPYCGKILLIAPPPMKRGAWVYSDALVQESIQLAEEYGKLASKLRIPFADTRDWKIDLCFDGVHFSEEGHHAFAEHLAEYFLK